MRKSNKKKDILFPVTIRMPLKLKCKVNELAGREHLQKTSIYIKCIDAGLKLLYNK